MNLHRTELKKYYHGTMLAAHINSCHPSKGAADNQQEIILAITNTGITSRGVRKDLIMPEVGDAAPEFELEDQNGNVVSLSKLKGKTVVLFFYPKANTPGCTVEACSFRNRITDYDTDKYVILGISPDVVKKQKKFADKFELPYPLLADADHAVAEAYGVWAEKSMYGKKYMGIERTTFVISPEGKLAHVFRKVQVKEHASEVLEQLKALNA